MSLVVSPKIRNKLLQKHGVTEDEVLQCFANRERAFLEDPREIHRTDPPTRWFVAETDYGKKLKVIFVPSHDGRQIFIKSAYAANTKAKQIYEKYAPIIIE